MASINSEVEESEKDLEVVMEPVALSDTPGSKFVDNLTEGNIEKKQEKGRKILGILRENLNWIKRVSWDQWLLRYGCDSSSERTRAYHLWPGKNVFFFHGRLICGPDPRGLLLTTFLVVLSSWVFAFYVGDDLPRNSTIVVTFSLILTVIVLVNLILVSAIDPGIIPRNDQACVEEIGSGTKRKRVTVNGVRLKLKYCRICKIFRPPRSCHCAVCDNCVEKFDHHCPWIGQCIALRNYRFYLTFLILALVFFVYIFTFSCWRIHQRMLQSGTGLFGMLIKTCPETLALASVSFAASGFLGGLVMFHVYLIAINQTAYENFRQHYLGYTNPYDKGILNNIREVLFAPLSPSSVDFRAEVTPRWRPTGTVREV